MKFSRADRRVNMRKFADVLPNHQHALKMGTELVTETSENLHILTRLSAQENFIELQITL
jgi:hypothetical protein